MKSVGSVCDRLSKNTISITNLKSLYSPLRESMKGCEERNTNRPTLYKVGKTATTVSLIYFKLILWSKLYQNNSKARLQCFISSYMLWGYVCVIPSNFLSESNHLQGKLINSDLKELICLMQILKILLTAVHIWDHLSSKKYYN